MRSEEKSSTASGHVRLIFIQDGGMQKKVFWLLFTVVSSITGLTLSIYWNLALALPLVVVCWWVVYRSGWFD